MDFEEEESVVGDVVRLTDRGRRTGFGGSLLHSDGFFSEPLLLSGAASFGLAVTSGCDPADERILDSLLERFSPPSRG